MGRKSSSKGQGPGPGSAPPEKSGRNPLVLVAVLAAAVGIGVFAFWPKSDQAAPAADTASTPASDAPKMAVGTPPTPEIIAAAEAQARLGPHKQDSLPPIPFQGYEPPRSREVVRSAYQFAAEHPEVLSYVPCFCGCH